jgi:hypothetical protein
MRKVLFLVFQIFLIGCNSKTDEQPVLSNVSDLRVYIDLKKLCTQIKDLKWQEVNLTTESGIGPTDKIILATFKTDSILLNCTNQISKSNRALIKNWMPEAIKNALEGKSESCSGDIDDLLIDKYNFGYFILTQDRHVFVFMSKINK